MYLDANNLYGWAMSQHLPTSNFKWMTFEEIESFDIISIAENSNQGYILEVDIGNDFYHLIMLSVACYHIFIIISVFVILKDRVMIYSLNF